MKTDTMKLRESIEVHTRSLVIQQLQEQYHYTAKEACNFVEDHYIGRYNSLADYAKEWVCETNDLSNRDLWKFLFNNIDYEGLGRTLEKGDKISVIRARDNEGVHIFEGE